MGARRLAKNLSAEEHTIVLLQHTGTPIRIGVFGVPKKAQKLLDRRFFCFAALSLLCCFKKEIYLFANILLCDLTESDTEDAVKL